MAYEDYVDLLDLSYYQGSGFNIKWDRVRDEAGVKGIYNRLNYGTKFKDPNHDQFCQFEKEAGIPRGVYTFPLPYAESPAQAYDSIMGYASPQGFGEMPVMVDAENPPGVNLASAVGPQRLADWYVDLGLRLARGTGREPIMYGGFLGMTNDPRLKQAYPIFWVANYGSQKDYATTHFLPRYRPYWNPNVPGPWNQWGIFQHTGGNGRCAGVPLPVDLNIIHPDTLKSLLNGFSAPAQKPQQNPQPAKKENRNMAIVHVFPDGAMYFMVPAPGPVVGPHANYGDTDLSGGKNFIWEHLSGPQNALDAGLAGVTDPSEVIHIPAEDQAAIDRFERYGVISKAHPEINRPPIKD